jgi:hypothetical protein
MRWKTDTVEHSSVLEAESIRMAGSRLAGNSRRGTVAHDFARNSALRDKDMPTLMCIPCLVLFGRLPQNRDMVRAFLRPGRAILRHDRPIAPRRGRGQGARLAARSFRSSAMRRRSRSASPALETGVVDVREIRPDVRGRRQGKALPTGNAGRASFYERDEPMAVELLFPARGSLSERRSANSSEAPATGHGPRSCRPSKKIFILAPNRLVRAPHFCHLRTNRTALLTI